MASPSLARLVLVLPVGLPVIAPSGREVLDTPAGKISYEVAGDGPALVLLHDGLLPAVGWDGVWDFCTARWRTLRYDRRGYGESEGAKTSYDDVADLATLLDHVGLARATMIGSSAGG